MATWSATTFCTPADVRIRQPDVDRAMDHGQGAVGNDIITAAITLAKDHVRQLVVAFCQRAFAADVQSWFYQVQSQYDRRRETSDAEWDRALIVNPVIGTGAIDTDGGTFSSEGRRILPQTFTNDGTPTNGATGTEAGYAENGARLIDTKYSYLYINRGTLAVPTWEKFTAESMIDYITNPTELKHCHVAYALYLLYERRVGMFTVTHEAGIERHAGMMNLFKAEAMTLFDRAIGLVTFDASNDGIVSESERSSSRTGTQYFA